MNLPIPPLPPLPPQPPLPPGSGGRWAFTGARRRARHPDVRAAVLLVLAEGDLSGYQIVNELQIRSRDMWRPSPGSVYPVLQLLQDEGLAMASGTKGNRTFQLTETGRAYVDEHRTVLGAPWDDWKSDADEGAIQLHAQLAKLVTAVEQVGTVGEPTQLAQAARLLARTRRELYLVLSESGTDPDASA